MVMSWLRATIERHGFISAKLLIVMAVFVILVSATVAINQRTKARAEERSRKNDLFTIRTAIDEFTYDKQRAPRSLQELVNSGYLRVEKVANWTPYSPW